MQGTFGILIVALFVGVTSTPIGSSEREQAIEDTIRNSFSDPVNFGNFSVGPGGKYLRVNQEVNNMIVTGLRKARITNIKADLTAGTIDLAYEADQLVANVDYKIDGEYLFIPIWGEGKGVVVMNDVRVTAKALVELVDDKINITDMKITFGVSGGSFDLDSFFNEPQPRLLTRAILKIINANSSFVFNQILDPYIPPSEAALARLWGLILAGR